MLNQDTTVLLTGVTGLIGGELIRKLARRGVRRIFCLIRPSDSATAADRLVERLRRSGDLHLLEECLSIEPVAGDVTSPDFGLSRADFATVTSSVNMIIHCASELSFIRDASCRETNIAGMNNLIDLARQCRKNPKIIHISTATICGIVRNRCIAEEDGETPNGEHYNEYTRSKAAAEFVLRESGLPSLVIRPSIVLSNNVPSENFAKAILWFLPLLNEFDAMPIDPAARADIVTVDFVVDCMLRLIEAERLEHDCYHISAGEGHATRCGDSVRYLDEYYERVHPLRLYAPSNWTREIHRRYVATPHQRKLFSGIKHYLPFLNMDVVYDNSRLKKALGDGPLHVPPIRSYIARMLDLITPPMLEAGVLTAERALGK